MEAKLRQTRDFHFLKFLQASPKSNPTSPPHRFCLKSCVSNKRSFKKRFRVLAERFRFQVQEKSKCQDSTKNFLVHVVKEGETLTLISKRYGVSMYAIAEANKDIVDIDLVFEGQHLNIPLSVSEDTQMCQTEKSVLPSLDSLERHQSSSDVLGRHLSQKIFILISSHHLPHAKTTGYFLVLVPLIAFCIRCIIGAFHNKVPGDLKHQAVNESVADHHGSRTVRWKSALRDIREPDILDAESRPDSDHLAEDQAQFPSEDLSHTYTKLEHDYQKFLSECGISNWGYWRGGSPE